MKLDFRWHAGQDLGQLLAVQDAAFRHAEARFEAALRMGRLDPVVAQKARHHQPDVRQRDHRREQDDRREMEDTHFRHPQIHRDRYDENVGRRADRRRQPAHERCRVERHQCLGRGKSAALRQSDEDREQQNQHRRVVDAHRKQEGDDQREQQAELEIDLEQTFQEAGRRFESACHHQTSTHDHQGADGDERIMAEPAKGDLEAVIRGRPFERKKIQTDRDDRDGQQRDDFHRHAAPHEGDEHGDGHRERRHRMIGRYAGQHHHGPSQRTACLSRAFIGNRCLSA